LTDKHERRGIILQHGDLGPPGVFEQWLRARDIPYEVHAVWRDPLPDVSGAAFLASLGSIHSVTQSDPAWVPAEVEAVREAVADDVPVLGLCFGGQALSLVLGGGVDRLEQTEIGWIPIESLAADELPHGPWLHWHNELLRIPPGATVLGQSPAGPAAFRHGRHLAVQFHPEATPAIVDGWALADPALESHGITREELAEQSRRHGETARQAAFVLFDDWWARGPGRG
jgi:GMP synthase-like glutamine amidotransferase